MSEASISLLLKKGKDPHLCSSYRPISLLNVDFKILAKVLAGRFQIVIPSLINPDQTGFITGRHLSSNTRRLVSILYPPPTDSPKLVLFLDAEKAFDHMEWRYLFYILNKFGLGSDFVDWIKLIYTSPLASVSTNSIKSPYFSQHLTGLPPFSAVICLGSWAFSLMAAEVEWLWRHLTLWTGSWILLLCGWSSIVHL